MDKKIFLNDKPQPKFKVGDWVVNKFGDVWHIDSFDKKNYQVSDGKGNYNYFPIAKQNEMHLWSIAYAREGDVLIDRCDEYKNPLIFILKRFETVDFGLVRKSDYSSYCFLSMSDKPRFKEGNFHHIRDIKPATKEQRDLLFAKMRESGYEWNAEKKELKKIEQKLAWSDEDERMLDSIIVEVSYIGDFPDYPTKEEDELYAECLAKVQWLKSIKDRVQPKQEWSEDDEKIRKSLLEMVYDTPNIECEKIYNVSKEDAIAWLEKHCQFN